MRIVAVCLVAASLASCTKPPAEPLAEPGLVSQMKQALAEREKRLTSYQLSVMTKQGDAEATHEFSYRAPNRTLGTILTPAPMTLGFDGTRFFRVTPDQKKFETYELKLPFDKSALFLSSTFAPFVPEGYRTPLIPSQHVTAKRVAHPKGPDAVELTVVANDEGTDLTITYVLRHPSGELLAKRVGATELSVEQEHCDAALKLCVPMVVTQRENGVVVATTTVTKVVLNPALPADRFTLTAPEGYLTERHELVEAK